MKNILGEYLSRNHLYRNDRIYKCDGENLFIIVYRNYHFALRIRRCNMRAKEAFFFFSRGQCTFPLLEISIFAFAVSKFNLQLRHVSIIGYGSGKFKGDDSDNEKESQD